LGAICGVEIKRLLPSPRCALRAFSGNPAKVATVAILEKLAVVHAVPLRLP
jgi:hypothetical protein